MKRFLRAVALAAACLIILAAVPLTVSAAYENTHINTGNQPADLVAVAKTQLGYKEGANDYSKYGAAYNMANAPWCGFFVSWCARQAGIPKAVIPDSGAAKTFFSAGTYHARTSGYTPTVGDLILYGSLDEAEHVGIVERYDAATGRVYVLDGNWSDQVSNHYTTLSDSEVAGFVTPAYTSTMSEMGVYNMVVPKVIPVGGVFSISGFVASPHIISSVNITVADENGDTCLSQTASPNAETYELSALDAGLRFNDLDPGTYSYIVTATDTVGTKRWSYLFEVVGEVTFELTDAVLPTSVAKGGFFCVFGTVSSAETLKTVSVEVYNTAGAFCTGGTLSVGTTTFDIHRLDDYLAFDALSKGSYTLRITAQTAYSRKVWESPFTVGDTMKQEFVFRAATVPSPVTAGQTVAAEGEVVSSHRITSLKATVTDKNGTAVKTASASPSSTTVLLGTAAVPTTGLAAGEYTLTLTASGAYGSAEKAYPFTVEAAEEPAPPTVEFTLSGETVPTAIKVGGVFSVYGTVTASEALQEVTVLVTDTAGTACIRVTASPNATSYDLHKMDDDITFNTLSEGHYTYSIKAVTASAQTQWDYAFKVGNPAPLPEEPSTDGDLNGDGTVNMMDAMLLYGATSGGRDLTESESAAADLNGDGSVNMMDAALLYKAASGA